MIMLCEYILNIYIYICVCVLVTWMAMVEVELAKKCAELFKRVLDTVLFIQFPLHTCPLSTTTVRVQA
jgi:hypothetical protein